MGTKKDEVDVLGLKKRLDATNIDFVLLGDIEFPVMARKVKVVGKSINSTIIAHVVTVESDSEVRIGENAKIFCGTFFTDCPSLDLGRVVNAGKIFIRPGRNCSNWIEREGDSNFLILREDKSSSSF
ncbi:MAG: hypothetical protein PHH21_03050 [Candidatus Pacebacteria bacterium]|nr:hypothetical protein [Candidatus Paceibacterota bacterium]